MNKPTLIVLFLTILMFSLVYAHEENQAIFQQEVGKGVVAVVMVSPYKPPELPSDLNLTISVLFYNGTYEETKPTLEHITLSVWIKDDKNNVIKEFKSIHVHEGNFTFSYQFPSKGKYFLEVQLERIGHMHEETHAHPSFSKAGFELFIGISPTVATTTPGMDMTTLIIIAVIIAIAVAGIFLLLSKQRTKAPS